MTPSDERDAIQPAGEEPAEDSETDLTPVERTGGPTGEDGERIAWGRLLFMGGVLLILLVAAVWGWIVFVNQLNSPEAAVGRMMDAYANYDATGVLQYTTHYSITKQAEAAFIEQSAKAKERAGGKPLVRNIVVDSIEMRGDNAALARVTADWLVDPAKGTYRRQTTPIPLVKKDGQWIVQMF